MNPDGFLADILDEPATLARVLDRADVARLRAEIARARLVVLTGMGSSRFAALTAAARLRAAGIAAVVEYASTDVPTAPAPDVLAIGISATGNSAETVAALALHHGTSKTIAITNADDGGKLGRVADLTVPLHAGTEQGGVACKTFQATLAVLLLAAGVEAAALAPAADATETGDWSHVDVYLNKYPNYTALLFPGSRYDAEAIDWLTQRASNVITVGRPAPGLTALQHIPYNNADDDLVAALVDVTVAELAAATWWRRRLDADQMP